MGISRGGECPGEHDIRPMMYTVRLRALGSSGTRIPTFTVGIRYYHAGGGALRV